MVSDRRFFINLFFKILYFFRDSTEHICIKTSRHTSEPIIYNFLQKYINSLEAIFYKKNYGSTI